MIARAKLSGTSTPQRLPRNDSTILNLTLTLVTVAWLIVGCSDDLAPENTSVDAASDASIFGFTDTGSLGDTSHGGATNDTSWHDASGLDAGQLDAGPSEDVGAYQPGDILTTDTAVAADIGSLDIGSLDTGAVDAGIPDTNVPMPPCGNGVCSDVEAIQLCAIDCDPMSKQVWTCAATQCNAQRNTCLSTTGCMTAWQTTMLCMKSCGFKPTCVSGCAKEMAGSAAAQALGSCALPGCMSSGGVCGDGTCQSTETQQSCPADCNGASSCGDGACTGNETAQSCPTDCATTPTGGCGDEKCSAGENATACPLDCEPDAGKAWACMQSKCGSEKSACQASAACLSALNEAAICLKKCGSGSACAQQCQGPVVGNSKALSLAVCAIQQCPTP